MRPTARTAPALRRVGRARAGIRGTPPPRRRRARRRCRRRSSTRPAGAGASVTRVPRSESTRLHLGLDGPDVRLAVLIDRTSEAALARHDLGRAKVLVGVEEDEARTPRGLRGRRTRRRAAMCCRVERRAAMCCWSAARGVFRRRFFTWWTASERAGAWKASTAPAARSAMRARTRAMLMGQTLRRAGRADAICHCIVAAPSTLRAAPSQPTPNAAAPRRCRVPAAVLAAVLAAARRETLRDVAGADLRRPRPAARRRRGRRGAAARAGAPKAPGAGGGAPRGAAPARPGRRAAQGPGAGPGRETGATFPTPPSAVFH